MRSRLPADQYIEGILQGDRYLLSRAITLVESRRPTDQVLAQEILKAVVPAAGNSIRLGITGVPGVGKSTFIENFGLLLTQEHQKKIAVLAIDPSSPLSKGSILGDKTRMNTLSQDPNAFIRPSATGNTLGGVGRKTRETLLLCEAAGYEYILVETVGVGQSETLVRGMVDFFLLLMLPGAGDELQGIKRGIMEMADALVINKADGTNQKRAKQAQSAYQNALHLFPLNEARWSPAVLTCSALWKDKLADVFEVIQKYIIHTKDNGFWAKQRQEQNRDWFYETIREELLGQFFGQENVKTALPNLEKAVMTGSRAPHEAALALLKEFR